MQLPTDFDKILAIECSGLVQQAYEQFDHFKHNMPWSLQGNYDTLQLLHAKPEGLFAKNEPFGFVARNKASGNVFVTFRGTVSLGDWLSDFTFPQEPHPWGQAEQGFSFIYKQCSADVKAAVKAAGGAPVFVTGHSLGAGIAVLATADIVQSGTNAGATMYSFAGPRVGDLDFAAQFNSHVAKSFRVVNTEDIVTTVPIATPDLFSDSMPHSAFGILLALAKKLNYEHIGVPVSFTTHKGSIAGNHAMQVYIDALKAS